MLHFLTTLYTPNTHTHTSISNVEGQDSPVVTWNTMKRTKNHSSILTGASYRIKYAHDTHTNTHTHRLSHRSSPTPYTLEWREWECVEGFQPKHETEKPPAVVRHHVFSENCCCFFFQCYTSRTPTTSSVFTTAARPTLGSTRTAVSRCERIVMGEETLILRDTTQKQSGEQEVCTLK